MEPASWKEQHFASVHDHFCECIYAREVGEVAVVPIGFLSDHLEVIYDLDTEARQVCEKLGIKIVLRLLVVFIGI